MLQNIYAVEFSDASNFFEFDSVGPKGIIKKLVQYNKVSGTVYHNLAFGDKINNANELDDLVVTNNGDLQKVIATVAQTLVTFTNRYPDALVIATGSTPARTRLYRIAITNNLKAIEELFEIFGLKDNNWCKFEVNVNYDVLLVVRKNHLYED